MVNIWLIIYLVGGFNPSEKYESQLEGLSHILWKIKHVPNHQPVLFGCFHQWKNPNWCIQMLGNGKSYSNGWFTGTPISGNLHLSHQNLTQVSGFFVDKIFRSVTLPAEWGIDFATSTVTICSAPRLSSLLEMQRPLGGGFHVAQNQPGPKDQKEVTPLHRSLLLGMRIHGSLNVPIEHHPTIRYMVY